MPQYNLGISCRTAHSYLEAMCVVLLSFACAEQSALPQTPADTQGSARKGIAQIRGRVLACDGRPVAAEIEVDNHSRGHVDAHGFYAINATPGDVTLVVSAPGFESAAQRVEVAPAHVVIANFAIHRGSMPCVANGEPGEQRPTIAIPECVEYLRWGEALANCGRLEADYRFRIRRAFAEAASEWATSPAESLDDVSSSCKKGIIAVRDEGANNGCW